MTQAAHGTTTALQAKNMLITFWLFKLIYAQLLCLRNTISLVRSLLKRLFTELFTAFTCAFVPYVLYAIFSFVDLSNSTFCGVVKARGVRAATPS